LSVIAWLRQLTLTFGLLVYQELIWIAEVRKLISRARRKNPPRPRDAMKSRSRVYLTGI
jgi:hypothetical protein